jgi:hypothetical protein
MISDPISDHFRSDPIMFDDRIGSDRVIFELPSEDGFSISESVFLNKGKKGFSISFAPLQSFFGFYTVSVWNRIGHSFPDILPCVDSFNLPRDARPHEALVRATELWGALNLPREALCFPGDVSHRQRLSYFSRYLFPI